jgi:hypothetical protein
MRHVIVMCFLVGGLAALGSLISMARTALFVMRAAEAPGRVTQIRQSDDSTQWHLTCEFTDNAGIVHEMKTSFQAIGTEPLPRQGDKVTVLYDRSNAKRANVDSFQTLWGTEVFVLAIGLFVVGGGSVFSFLSRRITAAQQN